MTEPPPPEQPPSAAWSPPPAPPAVPRSSGVTITLLPGQLVALAGGVLIVVSAWLDWIRPSHPFGPATGLSAYDVPAQFLVRNRGLFLSRTGPLTAIVGGILSLSRR